VREELLKKIEAELKGGAAIAIWSYPNPQGYRYQTIGKPSRQLVDFEGIALVRLDEASGKESK